MFTNSNFLNCTTLLSTQCVQRNYLAGDQLQKANELFREAWTKGCLFRIWSRLTHQNAQLLDLSEVRHAFRLGNSIDCGIRSVLVEQIRGSENRSTYFDAGFYPLQYEDRQRWANIANLYLMHSNIQAVNLIQVGNVYFVRDGHHRISVAHALGARYIDAEVIQWKSRDEVFTSGLHQATCNWIDQVLVSSPAVV